MENYQAAENEAFAKVQALVAGAAMLYLCKLKSHSSPSI